MGRMHAPAKAVVAVACAATLCGCDQLLDDVLGTCDGPEDVGFSRCDGEVVERCDQITPDVHGWTVVIDCRDWDSAHGGGYQCQESPTLACAYPPSGDACCVKPPAAALLAAPEPGPAR